MAGWIAFFDSDNPIYVNARHRDAHAQLVGSAILSFAGDEKTRVLDFGAGEARYAERVAARVAWLTLCEAAPQLRERVRQRIAGAKNIRIVAPQELAEIPDKSFELIVMISVSQYLVGAELDALLAMFRRLLAPGGALVVGDVVPPQVGPLNDALALLRFGAAKGFFLGALFGLLRLAMSPYRKLRHAMGLTRYSENDMRRKLAAAGYEARRAQSNVGHIAQRMTFVARLR